MKMLLQVPVEEQLLSTSACSPNTRDEAKTMVKERRHDNASSVKV